MFKNTVITLILFSAGLWQVAAVAQTSSSLDNYTPQIQEQAQQLIDKGWLVERRFNRVRGWLEKWEELARDCDNFSNPNSGTFDSFACKNYARSTRGNRMVSYHETCEDLSEWRAEKEAELRSASGSNQNSTLAQATEAAIAEMTFEVNSLCATWGSGGLSADYRTMVLLETTEDRASHEFVMQFRRANPGVYGGPRVIVGGGGFKQPIVVPLTRPPRQTDQ